MVGSPWRYIVFLLEVKPTIATTTTQVIDRPRKDHLRMVETEARRMTGAESAG